MGTSTPFLAELPDALRLLAEAIGASSAKQRTEQADRRELPTVLQFVSPSNYVTIDLAATLTGYSKGAIRAKIHKGTWLENREWYRAPDGRVLISLSGYSKWVEGRGQSSRPRTPS